MTDGPLPIVTDDAWPDDLIGLRDSFAGRLNVYRAMANYPALLAAWAALRDHVVTRSTLSRRHLEIVVLRTGWHWQSRYEWMHHIMRARAIGMDDHAIARCAAAVAGPESDDQAALLTAVDALMAHGRIEPAARAALVTVIGVQGLLDLVATIGMYTTLAFLLNTFEVSVDADVAAELYGDPLAAMALRRGG